MYTKNVRIPQRFLKTYVEYLGRRFSEYGILIVSIFRRLYIVYQEPTKYT